ncbi:MAG: LCP family protein [Nocardioidaceae bacterium]
MLVGSDSRADLSKQQRGDLGTGNAAGQRTDTIIVLHVPSGPGPEPAASLPRDSYVDIPGKGKNKINAAYAFGGAELLVATVEQNTGLRIDDYIEVGFTGFVDVVDAVGGIQVCPKSPIDDPKAGHLKMKKGCQDVDGNTALQYSRSRAFGNGDITRAQHQREVIASVGQRGRFLADGSAALALLQDQQGRCRVVADGRGGRSVRPGTLRMGDGA